MTTRIEKQSRRKGAARKEELWGYAFIAPQFIGIVCFIVFPVFFSLYISFTKWNMMSPIQWIGLENYVKIFSKSEIWEIIGNTFFYVIMYVPASLLMGLLLALGLNKKFRGVSILRTAFFLPNITSSVAVALIWAFMFQKDSGVVNLAIKALTGIDGPNWLNSLKWAMPAIAIVSVWSSMGYNMIILLAGLKGIDETYYEAARIDGASALKSFFHITLPMLSPTFFFILCTGFISGFQMFNEAYMMTGGGPGRATTTITMKVYKTAFEYWRMGEASVWAWVLFVIVLAITGIQFSLQKKWVNYDV